jgi:hypothetical protein
MFLSNFAITEKTGNVCHLWVVISIISVTEHIYLCFETAVTFRNELVIENKQAWDFEKQTSL